MPSKPLSVLIAGRSEPQLEALRRIVDGLNTYAIDRKLINNGHSDPLYGVRTPDLLIYSLGPDWEEGLQELAMRPAEGRPAIIVVGQDDTRMMRTAMRAGVLDYLPFASAGEELPLLLSELRDELSNRRGARGSLIAFNGVRGGAGTSTVAANVAHILASAAGLSVCLVEFDLTAATMPYQFGLEPAGGLLDLIEELGEVDGDDIERFMLRHSSGLDLLCSAPGRPALFSEFGEPEVGRLFERLVARYDVVIADVPRGVYEGSAAVLEMADRILPVMQQELTAVREARRNIELMTEDLELERSRLHLVVNRYREDADISLHDIKAALGIGAVSCIDNDFHRVSESISGGTPLYGAYRDAPVTRDLLRLSALLFEDDAATSETGNALSGE